MAYEYDRFEREDGGGSFLMGLLAGTMLGAGLGMLFAPRPGSELRTQLTEQAGRFRTTAGGAYTQASGKVDRDGRSRPRGLRPRAHQLRPGRRGCRRRFDERQPVQDHRADDRRRPDDRAGRRPDDRTGRRTLHRQPRLIMTPHAETAGGGRESVERA